MPTTRSISNAKKTSSSKVDVGKGGSAEEPESRLSDVGELSGDLQVRTPVVFCGTEE
jgi:hypothetical protein